MAITFDEIRDTMPDNAAKDDKSIEKALSVVPARILLLMDTEEMGVLAHRFGARLKQASRNESDA